MIEILNLKDIDRIRQMQKMDRFEPHEKTIEDLLATIEHLLAENQEYDVLKEELEKKETSI